MKKFKVITRLETANKLIKKGFKIHEIDRDKFNRQYLIFIFNWSEKLEEELKT